MATLVTRTIDKSVARAVVIHVTQYNCAKLIYLLTRYGGGSSISQTGGVNPRGGSANILFGQFFLESCMKMNEIGPRWGLFALPLHPPMDLIIKTTIKFKNNNNLFTKKKTLKYVCAQAAKIFSGFVLIFCINCGTRNFTLIKVTPFA